MGKAEKMSSLFACHSRTHPKKNACMPSPLRLVPEHSQISNLSSFKHCPRPDWKYISCLIISKSYLNPWLSQQTQHPPALCWQLGASWTWDKDLSFWNSVHRAAFVRLLSRRAMVVPSPPLLPQLKLELTVLFWNLPKADNPRTYNCRGTVFAGSCVCVGCEKQMGPAADSALKFPSVWC